MHTISQARPRPSQLPATYGKMVRRIHNGLFQIIGLPTDANDPTFPDRGAAEEWLAERLPTLHPRLKRGPRACLTCQSSFTSEGPHNRLCDRCRSGE